MGGRAVTDQQRGFASLKQDLTAALDVGSDFDSNAVVILNPTADRIPENGNCAPGNWRTPAAFRIRPRALALPPVIDAAGYWLVTSKANGKLDVERLEQLSLVPALGLSQAGQCF